jgi:hypothetical protein
MKFRVVLLGASAYFSGFLYLMSGSLVEPQLKNLAKIHSIEYVAENAVFLSAKALETKTPDVVGEVSQIIDGSRWFLVVKGADQKYGPYMYDNERQYLWEEIGDGRSSLTVSSKEERSDFVISANILMALFSGFGKWDKDSTVFHQVFNLNELADERSWDCLVDLKEKDLERGSQNAALTKVRFRNPFLSDDKIGEIRTFWKRGQLFPVRVEAFSDSGNRAFTYEVIESKNDLDIGMSEPLSRPYAMTLDVFDPRIEKVKQVSQQHQLFTFKKFLVNKKYSETTFQADPAFADAIYDKDNNKAIKVPR